MTQIMNFLLEEIALGLFQLEVSLLEFPEDDFDVFQVIFLILAENDDVVQVGHRKIAAIL